MPVTIVIAGTTGCGKTEVAERLSRGTGSEIVSADSRCFYRGVSIGNGKFTMDLSLPYHLVDVSDPDVGFTVRDFVREAGRSLGSIHERGTMAIVCGGSMLHLERLLKGMAEGPGPDPALRSWLDRYMEEFGAGEAWSMLKELDEDAARSLDPNDGRRIRRSLETILTSNPEDPPVRGIDGDVIGYFLDRDDADLSSRVRSRARTMLGMGWSEEVEGLIKAYGQDIPGLQMVGVSAVQDLMAGRCTERSFIEKVTRETMRLARSQRKWAKRLPLERIDLSVEGTGCVADRILGRAAQHVE